MQRRKFLRNIFGAAIASKLPLPVSVPAKIVEPKSLLLNDLNAQSAGIYSSLMKKYGNENYAMVLETLGRTEITDK